jgi:hypothetical protein
MADPRSCGFMTQFFSVERVSGISAYETDWLS